MNIHLKTLLVGLFLVGTLTQSPHQAYAQNETTTKENTVALAFSDVSEEDFIYPASQYLFERGIFQGYPNGSFGRGGNMNRAELITVMVRMQGVEPKLEDFNNCFPDVAGEDVERRWFVPYVCYAKTQGWIQGYPDGLFRPENPTQKMEGLKIILNTFFSEKVASQTPKEIEFGIYINQALLEGSEAYTEYNKGYSGYKTTWFGPYLSFAGNKNLFAQELVDKKLNFVEGEASREYIAELIFRALLMKEGAEGKSWEEYDDYLRDRLFLNTDRKDMLSPNYPCYGYYNDTLPNFAGNYLKQKYSFTTLTGLTLEAEKENGPTLLPEFRMDFFCFLENGGLMVTGYSQSKDYSLSRHLLSFDKKEVVQKDESLECPNRTKLDLWHSFNQKLRSIPSRFSAFIKELDPETFEWIDCRYSKDAKRVYLYDYILEGSFPDTFKALSYPYAKDEQTVYVEEEPLIGADAESFEIIPATQFESFGAAAYAKDKNHVYFLNRILEEVNQGDLDSFKVLSIKPARKDLTQLNSNKTDVITLQDLQGYLYKVFSYAKDENHVYLAGEIMEQFDAKSFEALNEMYQKDKNGVYFFGEILEGADPNTFEILREYYAKDAHFLYHEGEKIDLEGLNVSALEFLNDYYFKDDKQVYYWHHIVKGADPMSAEVILPKNPEYPFESEWLRTEDAIYFQNKPFTACTDPKSFELINENYAKDSNHVYNFPDFGYPEIVEGADPNTFTL